MSKEVSWEAYGGRGRERDLTMMGGIKARGGVGASPWNRRLCFWHVLMGDDL